MHMMQTTVIKLLAAKIKRRHVRCMHQAYNLHDANGGS